MAVLLNNNRSEGEEKKTDGEAVLAEIIVVNEEMDLARMVAMGGKVVHGNIIGEVPHMKPPE